MSVLGTGAGLIGTSFAREAIKRGEKIVFFDPEPRKAFIDFKCGAGTTELVRGDVRDLPALLDAVDRSPVVAAHVAAGIVAIARRSGLRSRDLLSLLGHRYGGEVAYATAPMVVIDTPPPAPYAEVIPAMPYAGAVWIGGYWGWSGGRHHWVPGYWERPRPGYRWEPHRWESRGGHWQLHMGGWVRM